MRFFMLPTKHGPPLAATVKNSKIKKWLKKNFGGEALRRACMVNVGLFKQVGYVKVNPSLTWNTGYVKVNIFISFVKVNEYG